MGATFSASVLQAAGLAATGLPVPDQALEALGASRKQAVTVRVSEYCYRSTVAIRFGGGIIPLSAAHRDAPGLNAGDMVDVTIALDSEPRTVRAPDDLAASLAARVDLRAAFDSLAPSERGACVNTRTTSPGAQSAPGLRQFTAQARRHSELRAGRIS